MAISFDRVLLRPVNLTAPSVLPRQQSRDRFDPMFLEASKRLAPPDVMLLILSVPTNPPTPGSKLLRTVVKDCMVVAALRVLTEPAAAIATPTGKALISFDLPPKIYES